MVSIVYQNKETSFHFDFNKFVLVNVLYYSRSLLQTQVRSESHLDLTFVKIKHDCALKHNSSFKCINTENKTDSNF
jgi:hypothetical protein